MKRLFSGAHIVRNAYRNYTIINAGVLSRGDLSVGTIQLQESRAIASAAGTGRQTILADLTSTVEHENTHSDHHRLNTESSPVQDISKQMASYLQHERLDDAKACYDKLKDQLKLPANSVLRLYVKQLARAGQIDDIHAIGSRVTLNTRKDISYSNFLCDAYVLMDKAEQYLEQLIDDVRRADTKEKLLEVNAALPHRAIMTMLQQHPDLHQKLSVLAQEYACKRNLSVVNVFWQYYVCERDWQSATFIWNTYFQRAKLVFVHDIINTANERLDAEPVEFALKQLRTSPNIATDIVATMEAVLTSIKQGTPQDYRINARNRAEEKSAQQHSPAPTKVTLNRSINKQKPAEQGTTNLDHLF